MLWRPSYRAFGSALRDGRSPDRYPAGAVCPECAHRHRHWRCVGGGHPNPGRFPDDGHGPAHVRRHGLVSHCWPCRCSCLPGALMEAGGISRRIIDLANALVGWLPGGLAAVTIVSAMFFCGDFRFGGCGCGGRGGHPDSGHEKIRLRLGFFGGRFSFGGLHRCHYPPFDPDDHFRFPDRCVNRPAVCRRHSAGASGGDLADRGGLGDFETPWLRRDVPLFGKAGRAHLSKGASGAGSTADHSGGHSAGGFYGHRVGCHCGRLCPGGQHGGCTGRSSGVSFRKF